MSYEKLSGTPKELSFYYLISDLFDLNQLWSQYKVIHLDVANESEESILEEMALTVDEEDIFLKIASDGVFDIFNRFAKYTTGITDAIQFNVDYTPSGGSQAKYTFLKIVDHETYNVNYPNVVDKILEKCLKFYIIKEWFAMKDMNENAVKAGISYAQNIKELLHHSFQLKKVALP